VVEKLNMEKDLRLMKEKARKIYNRFDIRNTWKGMKRKQSTTLKRNIFNKICNIRDNVISNKTIKKGNKMSINTLNKKMKRIREGKEKKYLLEILRLRRKESSSQKGMTQIKNKKRNNRKINKHSY
jgi:predicted RNA-binding protein with EMAP domain